MTTAISAAPARRTQTDRTAAARASLVEATIASLAERGYAHTTTAVIAKLAGVTTGALHHHFPTKESLFIAALDKLATEALALFSELSDHNAAGHPSADGLIDSLWSLYGSRRYWAVWEINIGSRQNEAMLAELVEHRRETRTAMLQTIENNPALSAQTRRTLVTLLPFFLSSMRGIFLDTFFSEPDSPLLQDQLARLKRIFNRELALDTGLTASAKPASKPAAKSASKPASKPSVRRKALAN